MVSRDLEKQCVVVFDEAHNIDNVCIEVGGLSSAGTVPAAGRSLPLPLRAHPSGASMAASPLSARPQEGPAASSLPACH